MTRAASPQPFEVPLEDNDFSGDYPAAPLPESARARARAALEEGETHYVNVPGIPPVRRAAADFLALLGAPVPSERILITAGEQEARFLALRALLGAEERVALPGCVAPEVEAVLSALRTPYHRLPVEQERGLLPSIEAIGQALAEGCTVLYLESPSRLTGRVFTAEEVEEVALLLEAHGAFCVWEQSTAPAVVGDYPSLLARAPERTLGVGYLWPGMGLGVWQLGYVAAPTSLLKELTRLKQVTSICTGTPAQWAGVGLAEEYAERHGSLRMEMEAIRQEVLSALDGDARVIAGDSVNVLALAPGPEADRALARLNIEGARVCDGARYGAPGIVRVTMKPTAQTGRVVYSLLGGDGA